MSNNENFKDTNMTQSTFNEQFNQFTPDVFRDPLFGELRVFIDSNKQCWFIGYEVAERLGYQHPSNALNQHIRPEYRQQIQNCALKQGTISRGNPNIPIVLIHELGLYALCMRSQLPNAIPFQNWVYQTIQNMRMYGVSMSPQLQDVLQLDPNKLYDIAKQRQDTINRLENELYVQNGILNNIVDIMSMKQHSVKEPVEKDRMDALEYIIGMAQKELIRIRQEQALEEAKKLLNR